MRLESKSKQQVINVMRKEWMQWPKKHAVIQQAAERIQLEDGRWKTLIRCSHCKELFERKNVQCNHIKPVGALRSTSEFDVLDYRARMFCHIKLLEPVCTCCHRHITNTTNRKEVPND